MINPDDKIPIDDSENSEADDQQSQKDIHSNGLDEESTEEQHTDKDLLKEAYDAAESSFTLDLGSDSKAHKPNKKD